MLLSDFRAEQGLTLAQTAEQLGLSRTSVGWLSEIENGKRDASLRLALRIEKWSGGRVTAASVCTELRTEGSEPAQGEGVDGPAGPEIDDVRVHGEGLAPSAAPGADASAGALQ